MVSVWILFLASTLLAYIYEENLTKDTGIPGERKASFLSSTSYVILLITLVLFAGLRTVMNDTATYIQNFMNNVRIPVGFGQMIDVDWTIGSNPLFAVYQRLLKTIFGGNGQIFIFCSSLFVTVSYLRFIRKYSPQFTWSIFTLLGFCIYAFSMAAIKQTLSIAIGIWAIPDMADKKYVKAIIRLMIAMLFHPYVLVLAALIFFRKNVWKGKTLLVLLGTVIAAVGFSAFVDLILGISGSLGDSYSEEYFTEGGVGIARVISGLSVPAVTFLAKDEINAKNNPFLNICVNATLISGCITFISAFGGAVFIGRVPSYFNLLTCITVATVFSTCDFQFKKVCEIAFVTLLCVYYFTYYNKYLIGYARGNWFYDIYAHAKLSSLFVR